jgi:shikimate dehydrogenase
MQKAAFQAAGIEATYDSIDVPPARLGEVLGDLHREGFEGLNLTAPLKETVWPYLEKVTDEAAECRAANTLRWEPGGWLGHATDGLGFRDWIATLEIRVPGARVLLLGAGGAARSIAPVLARLGPRSITIVSRRAGRARDLAEAVRSIAAVEMASAALDDPGGARSAAPWDVLIRALASEMIEGAERSWWDLLAERAAVLELNYGPRAAASMALARSKGLRFEDGMGLLLYQGARSFEFWTGVPAPIDAMRKALLEPAGRG